MSCAAPPLKTVRLGGELAKRFGREHRFAISDPAEAVRALCANFPEFRRHLIESDQRGVGYRVLVDRRDVPLEELGNPSGQATVRIVPVIAGAGKGGIFEIIAGVVLIAAAVALGPIGMGAGSLLSGAMAAQVGAIGLALVLGGITNLLSPQPKTNQQSYAIRGNVNVAAQGAAIPIGYGEMFCGSAVISAEVTVDQVPTSETGVPGLTAIVQTTTAASGATSNQVYASWDPAGLAIGYNVTVQGQGFGPVTAPRTNGTSVYVAVPGPGPYEVICNPVESDGSYGPGSTVQSVYVGAAP